MAPAPAVAGGTTALPTSSFPALIRLVLTLSGSVEQQGAVLGFLSSTAAVTGAGGVPAPAAPVPTAAAIACSPSVPAPSGSTSACAASATVSHGRCEHAQESSRPERCHGQSTGRERSRSGGKRATGRSPSPARSARLASASASSSDPRSRRVGGGGGGASALPPPPASRSGAGGGHSRSACSASGRARSSLPSPSRQSSSVRAAPRTDRSRLGLHGLSSPTPSGVAEEDRDNISGSVDLDRDDSFRSVLHLIREFHGLEEPASVASNWCKTSLASIYGLQSESSPALHLPLSLLLSSLLEDTDLALAKFVKDQTVYGFLLVPDRRHRRYYKISSSSFPGPYTVPPELASITLDKVSESKKCCVSLSHSQASSLETMLTSVCEVTSWLGWWFSTCGGFWEHLPVEARDNFEWLMLSGSRALEFLGVQGITALGSLVLSHRDSLLVDAWSTLPAEEVARFRYANLPSPPGIFPSPLLDSALTKMCAALNDALVQQTLHPPKITRKSLVGPSKAGS